SLMWPFLSRYCTMSSIFSRADVTCSGEPLSFNWVPLDKIFKRGNFFFRMSSLPLFTPKNSIGFTVSRLMIVSVNSLRFYFLNAGIGWLPDFSQQTFLLRCLPLCDLK